MIFASLGSRYVHCQVFMVKIKTRFNSLLKLFYWLGGLFLRNNLKQKKSSRYGKNDKF